MLGSPPFKASIDHLISNQLAEPALPNASKEATKKAVGVFRGWGYEGSDDYNYLDAIEFALKNKAGFDQFCKMVAHMPSGDCDRMMYEAHPEGTFWEQMRFSLKFGLALGGLLFGSVLMADIMPVGLGAKAALEFVSASAVRAAAAAPVLRVPTVGDLMAQVPKGETLATWGKQVWGTKAEGAEALIGARSADELRALGLTRENATMFRDYYQWATYVGRGADAAPARVRLMNDILKTLGG